MLETIRDLALQSELQHIANLVLVVGFVLALIGEVALPPAGYRWNRSRLTHGLHNLLLWLAGVVVLSFVFGSSIWLTLRWLQFHHVGVLYQIPMPPWLLAVAAFLLLDASDYVFHRLSHNVRWLWLLHAVHHSDSRIDVTTNLRQHPLHIVFTELWKLVACAAIGVPAWVFLLHEIVNLGIAHLHHAAIRWPRWIDRGLPWVVLTPRMHWNHHSPSEPLTNSNYGVILSIWDRAFGTLTHAGRQQETEFGLSELRAPRWHSAWGMLATPWRARPLPRL